MYLARHARVEQQYCRLHLEVRLGIRQLAFASQENERPAQWMVVIIDTESYLDLQQSYRAYNFVSEFEIRAVRVLSRPYNQGTYGRCAGMARRPLTV